MDQTQQGQLGEDDESSGFESHERVIRDADVLISTTALADAMGLTMEAIRRQGLRGAPKAGRGLFNLRDYLRWWVANRGTASGARPNGEPSDLEKARTEKLQMELSERRGELVPAVEKEAALVDLVTSLVAALDAAPAQVTRDPALQAALETAIEDAREYLCQCLDQLRPRPGAGDPETAAPAQRRPVGRPASVATRG